MALAETILRKVHKLGLLSKIIRLLPAFSLLLLVSTIGWLMYLPLEGNYRRTYISENALMPAQVTSYFRESEWNFVRGYRHEVKGFENDPIQVRNQILEGWLKNLGVVTAYHSNGKYNDTLYAVMHAPRGEDTEAMVLAVPWITSEGEYNEGGIALSVTLLRYFSRMSIWSKNIIVVYPQNGHYPLRSWVEAYHTSLENTAGSLEAALVLEFGKNGDFFEYFELDYDGLNGQMPNLDLINTAISIGQSEGLRCSLHSASSSELDKNTYMTRLKTLFKGIISSVLSGLITRSPGCEAFSGWQIQAITLRAKGNSGGHDVTQFGRVVDSTFRSINNLLERFHQSFFFYLLMSPRNFVSIGTYLPSAILVAVSFAVSALSSLLSSGLDMSYNIKSVSSLLTLFTSIESVNLVLSFGLPFLVEISENKERASFVILNTLAGISFILSLSPLFREHLPFRLSKALTHSLIALSLLFISMLITALLIVHFSLALTVGVLSSPLMFVTNLQISSQKSGRGGSYVKKLKLFICFLVSNPFVIVFAYDHLLLDFNGGQTISKGLLTSWNELQCWTWFVVTLAWLTAWNGVLLAYVGGTFGSLEISDEKKIQ